MTRPTTENLEQQARESLTKVFSNASKVPSAQLKKLINSFEFVEYNKNTEIISKGEVSENFYFIYKGVVKVYYYKNKKPIVDHFENEGKFFGTRYTYLKENIGNQIFEAIDDVVLLKIKYEDFLKLCNESHEIERLYRIGLELLHINYLDTISTFKSLNSEEKYQSFINKFSDIANRVSLKDIASFLEITPETLSRIRAK